VHDHGEASESLGDALVLSHRGFGCIIKLFTAYPVEEAFMSDENEEKLEDCPLCKDQVRVNTHYYPFKQFHCKRCGTFNVEKPCAISLRGSAPNFDLMGLAREKYEREKYERGGLLVLTDTDLGETKKQAPTTTAEKARRLLHTIARKSELLGQTIELDPKYDYPLVFGRNDAELVLFLEDFERRGWLDKKADSASISYKYKLTVKGWIEYESDKA
jgi:hypothetical protein